MSKAFTKEDDDAGFSLENTASASVPAGPFRITATGARLLAAHADPAVRGALAHAEVIRPVGDVAALGVIVRVRDEAGEARVYRLVSKEERALLGEGVSLESPLGRALLGARVGDVRELRAPRGTEELEIVGLDRDDA